MTDVKRRVNFGQVFLPLCGADWGLGIRDWGLARCFAAGIREWGLVD